MMLLPGLLCWIVYEAVVSAYPEHALALTKHARDVAQLVTGVASTLLGFLAAAITVIFGISSTRVFRAFDSRGNLAAFLRFYYVTLAYLVILIAMSLATLSDNAPSILVKLICFGLIVVGTHAIGIVVGITNLSRRAARES